MLQQNTDSSVPRKERVLLALALFAPVFVVLSAAFHDLRLTFSVAAAVLALDGYVAGKRRLHVIVQAALWAASLASAAAVLLIGASLHHG